MVNDILAFSFLIIGASLVALIIENLRKEICILFNIKDKKKSRPKAKKSTSKKNTGKSKSRTSTKTKTK